MKFTGWEQIKQLRKLLATDQPEPTQQAARVVAMQRDLVLPSKAGIILVVLYYLFYSGWFYEVPTTRSVVQEVLKNFFLIYVVCNAVAGLLFLFWRRLPPGLFQWIAFTLGLMDGLFMAGLTIVTGGFDSVVFWLFPGLILLNAMTIPLAMPQIVLNLTVSLFYLGAGLLHPHIAQDQAAMVSVPGRNLSSQRPTNEVPVISVPAPAQGMDLEPSSKPRHAYWSDDLGESSVPDETSADIFMLRVAVLWLLTICCYGAQVLWERQRIAHEEAGEFAARENQLHSAGRLAAEFAHQVKNPLAVIKNTAYSLQRSLRGSNASAGQQIEIIQEEVARADRVITQIMGYAQLSEGRVERLDVLGAINQSIEQVFPPVVPCSIIVRKYFTNHFPQLLMLRGHLSEILVNLLQNAREALKEQGEIEISAAMTRDHAIEIIVRDNGPGIPPDKLEQVFEAYFTTKETGTGLGLAIVRHNVELYGGTVRVESELGKGAKFTVTLPVKALPKPIFK